MSDRVVVVGRGLIGAATAAGLRARGHSVVTVGRTPARDGLACDFESAAGRRAFRDELRGLRPGRVVLTHGPSDVTWIESNEDAARAAHVGIAEVVADAGVPSVLVSTDNVFPGDRGLRRAADPIEPGNAYGRVKAEAERVLADSALVLRVSLVYGWTDGHRATYGQRCLAAARAGEPMAAPTDQSFTPIHVHDVAHVLTMLCRAWPPPTGTAHLAGPDELSRHDFARLAYRLAGADEDLVRPCLRADTHLASRPRYSSLACDEFPGLPRWRPMSPEAGLRLMLRTAPLPAGTP